MGAIRIARAASKRLRPLAKTAATVRKDSERELRVGVVDAGAAASELGARLGVRPGIAPAPDGLLVHVARAGEPQASSARRLAAHKEGGGRVLGLLLGTPDERDALELELLSVPPLELGDLRRPVDQSLDGLTDAVVGAMGDDAVAVARTTPELRAIVARGLIDRAAKRSAAIGAAGIVPGAQLPALVATQVRLVSQLAALHDRPAGRDRTIEIAGLVAAGYGWRRLARAAMRRLPGSKLVLRSGIAYGATRATGEAAVRRFSRETAPPGPHDTDSFARSLR